MPVSGGCQVQTVGGGLLFGVSGRPRMLLMVNHTQTTTHCRKVNSLEDCFFVMVHVSGGKTWAKYSMSCRIL